jgi:hypothetical protein
MCDKPSQLGSKCVIGRRFYMMSGSLLQLKPYLFSIAEFEFLNSENPKYEKSFEIHSKCTFFSTLRVDL